MWEWPARTRTTDFPTTFSCGQLKRREVQGLLMQVLVPTRHCFVHPMSMRYKAMAQQKWTNLGD